MKTQHLAKFHSNRLILGNVLGKFVKYTEKAQRNQALIYLSRQPFVNGLWDVFDDAGWMVRFLVDVEWNVSWFVVWQVFTVRQVECDVKKVYYFLIGFDSNLQTILGENANISFLISSACQGDALVTPRPLSLYKPNMQYRTCL